MTVIERVEQLKDVTEVEKGKAQRTYIVWIYGFAEPDTLREIEEESGWSLCSFNGSKGSDVGIVYADVREGDSEHQYDVNVTAFDVDRYDQTDT